MFKSRVFFLSFLFITELARANTDISSHIKETNAGLAGIHVRLNNLETRQDDIERSIKPHQALNAELIRIAEQVRDLKYDSEQAKQELSQKNLVIVNSEPASTGASTNINKKSNDELSLLTLFFNGSLYALAIAGFILTILGLIGAYIYRGVKRSLTSQIEDAQNNIVKKANIEATGKQLQSLANQAYYAYNTYKRCSEHTKATRAPEEGDSNNTFNTDAWQNYAFMDIAISLSEMAIDSANIIRRNFESTEHSSDLNFQYYELQDVLAHCNLCFYSAERLQDDCFFEEDKVKEAKKRLFELIKISALKLTQTRNCNSHVKDDWHHLKESLLHSEYYVDTKYAAKQIAFRTRLAKEIEEVLHYATLQGEREWYTKTANKWSKLGLFEMPET